MGDGSLTCVIPVRDPRGVRNWSSIQQLMEGTLRSLAAAGVRTVVAATTGTPMPSLHGAELFEFDIPYMALPENDRQRRYDLIRHDKGARIMHALTLAQPRGHVMVVDYDDLVHREVGKLPAMDPEANGWVIESGYVFDEGPICYHMRTGFNRLCGTSVIVRADLLRIPTTLEDIDLGWSGRMLGSHIYVRQALETEFNSPLVPTPFPAAAYRVGHGENVSGAAGVLATFLHPRLVRHPRKYLRRLMSLRPRRVLVDFLGS